MKNRSKRSIQPSLVVNPNSLKKRTVPNLKKRFIAYGFDCEICSSGEEAFKRIEAADKDPKPFQMVVIDYLMPKMNGKILAEKIKVHKNYRDVLRLVEETGEDFRRRWCLRTTLDWDLKEDLKNYCIRGHCRMVSKKFMMDLEKDVGKRNGFEIKTIQYWQWVESSVKNSSLDDNRFYSKILQLNAQR